MSHFWGNKTLPKNLADRCTERCTTPARKGEDFMQQSRPKKCRFLSTKQAPQNASEREVTHHSLLHTNGFVMCLSFRPLRASVRRYSKYRELADLKLERGRRVVRQSTAYGVRQSSATVPAYVSCRGSATIVPDPADDNETTSERRTMRWWSWILHDATNFNTHEERANDCPTGFSVLVRDIFWTGNARKRQRT